MVTTVLAGIGVILQIYTIYLIYRITLITPKDGTRAEKPERRFVTPFGSFAVESKKSSKRTTYNDDESLYERERE